MGTALDNCYKLLKPGGRIVFSDYTNPQLNHVKFIFGVLPSWWLSEDGRDGTPLLDEKAWDDQLRASKFSGLDIVVKDTANASNHRSSMMVTTKPKSIVIPFENMILLDPPNPSEAVSAMSARIGQRLEELGVAVEHLTLEQAATPNAKGKYSVSKKFIISLLEVETPVISDLSKTDFESLQKVLLQSSGGLWISRGGRQVDPLGDPAFCATAGFLRVFRIEQPDIRLHELNFSSQNDLSNGEAADTTVRVLRSLCNDELLSLESEFSERDGRIYVPRLFDEPHKNHSLQTIGSQPLPELQPFSQPNRPLKLDIGVPGMLDTLRFIDDPQASEALTDNDVEIEVLANSMNFL